MMIASEIDNTEDAIKAELEHVYVMASYINAERGRLDIVRHLVSAAIDELDSLAEEVSNKRPKLVQPANTGTDKSGARHD